MGPGCVGLGWGLQGRLGCVGLGGHRLARPRAWLQGGSGGQWAAGTPHAGSAHLPGVPRPQGRCPGQPKGCCGTRRCLLLGAGSPVAPGPEEASSLPAWGCGAVVLLPSLPSSPPLPVPGRLLLSSPGSCGVVADSICPFPIAEPRRTPVGERLRAPQEPPAAARRAGGEPHGLPPPWGSSPKLHGAAFAGGSAPGSSCSPSLTPLLSTPQGPAVSDGGKAAPRILTRGGGSPAGPRPPCSDGALGAGLGHAEPGRCGGGCLFAKSCLASGRTRRAGSLAEQRAASSAGGALGCCPPPAGSAGRLPLCAPSSSGKRPPAPHCHQSDPSRSWPAVGTSLF